MGVEMQRKPGRDGRNSRPFDEVSCDCPHVLRLEASGRCGGVAITRSHRGVKSFLDERATSRSSADIFVGIPAVSDFTDEVQLASRWEADTPTALSAMQLRERPEHLERAGEGAHREPDGPCALVGLDVHGDPDASPRGSFQEASCAIARSQASSARTNDTKPARFFNITTMSTLG